MMATAKTCARCCQCRPRACAVRIHSAMPQAMTPAALFGCISCETRPRPIKAGNFSVNPPREAAPNRMGTVAAARAGEARSLSGWPVCGIVQGSIGTVVDRLKLASLNVSGAIPPPYRSASLAAHRLRWCECSAPQKTAA